MRPAHVLASVIALAGCAPPTSYEEERYVPRQTEPTDAGTGTGSSGTGSPGTGTGAATGSTAGTPTDSGGEVPATDTGEADPCARAGYLESTEGLEGDALREQLAADTAAQTCADYGEATLFLFTRLDRESDGEVECVYTGRRIAVGNEKPDPDEFNTEHTWPQSRGAEQEPEKCDLHHLYPTDTQANSERGNTDFGEVTGDVEWSEGGSRRGQGQGGEVFEPRDVHKGNVARSMLYFSVRYGHPLGDAEQTLYQRWHRLDPVDGAELERTFAIAANQVLANPFVACPDLVDRL